MRAFCGTWSLAVAVQFAACDADTATTPDASAPDAAPADAMPVDAAAGGASGTGGTADPGGTPAAPGGSFGGLGGSVTGVERPVGACALDCSCSTWFVAPPYPPDPVLLFETACANEGGTPIDACPEADLRGVCERAVEFFVVRRAHPARAQDGAQCPASTEDLRAACEAEGGVWE
jgi:hypothetical protein